MNFNIIAIASGQFLSILNTFTGIFSKLLIILGLNTPLFQIVWNYFLLFVIYLSIIIYTKRQIAWKQLWKYALASLTDTQCNFLVILGYEYTSIISVFTLSNSSVIMVMILSFIFLKRRFSYWEYGGAGVALTGVICVVLSDLNSSKWEWGGTIHGDLCVLFGTLLYSITNIWSEHLFVNNHDPNTYLTTLGFSGMLITLTQSLIMEYDYITSIDSISQVGCYAGFAICLASMYSISPYYFVKYGATMYNLSLLTSLLYGVIFGVLLFHEGMSWFYIISFTLVLCGIVIYNKPKAKEVEKGNTLLALNDSQNKDELGISLNF
ncbi:unnamed protein product [Blepharisma stoltei]|uniref:Solute carrier family 35 member F2 n=1 Tax=Blepharisma stoltei TaxID=1481888 RepID=A0AAU9JF62_9CILI|nr:unnamed protein product [Blepharisma stoltei]